MFRVEIVEVTERQTTRHNYQKVADSGNPRDGGAIYEHIPLAGVENVERKVLTQEVETIDLPSVIRAINNL